MLSLSPGWRRELERPEPAAPARARRHEGRAVGGPAGAQPVRPVCAPGGARLPSCDSNSIVLSHPTHDAPPDSRRFCELGGVRLLNRTALSHPGWDPQACLAAAAAVACEGAAL